MSNTKNQLNNAESQRIKLRMAGLRIGICLLLLLLLFKILYIKIAKGEIFEKYAVIKTLNGSDNTEQVLKPVRGFIYDRNSRQLAVSETLYDIILDVKVLNSLEIKGEKEKILEVTAFLLDKDINELTRIADDPRYANKNYVKIELGVSFEKWSEIKSYINKEVFYEVFSGQMTEKEAEEAEKRKEIQRFYLNCIHGEMDIHREYPRNTFAPQVIGFRWTEKDNNGTEEVSYGLEKSYNTNLSGKPGRRFRTYLMDGYPGTEETQAVPGHSLVTALDATIQDYAQAAVDKAFIEYKAQNTAIIVMDPYTGEVLAMAQSPAFNSNEPDNIRFFTDNWITALWSSMNIDEKNNALYEHWFNFSISKPFEPGSIFKPIVVAAALEEGIITPDDTFICNGYKMVSGQGISCWIAAEGGAHGKQTLTQALANSCNVAIMDIAEKMGREQFFKYRNDFGYGEKTGIDLPDENAVSDPWLMFSLDQLNPVELATSSFGQGFSATAIQAITSFSALINGGYLVKPYIVSKIQDSNGNILEENKKTLIRRVISSETSDILRVMLNSVVSPGGTGRMAIIDGYNIGGKTGTGQQITNKSYKDGKLTLTFIAFLPVEDPEFIALAVIDNPLESTQGSISAVPMLREVLENIIAYKNIRPSGDIVDEDDGSIPMPDYQNAPLLEVTQSLNNLGLDFICKGDGDIVIRQFPAANERVTPGSEIILFLNSSGGELAIVPDVNGLAVEEALTLIRDADLTAAIVYKIEDPELSTTPGSSTESKVYKQMPEPGRRIQKGAELKLKVLKIS